MTHESPLRLGAIAKNVVARAAAYKPGSIPSAA